MILLSREDMYRKLGRLAGFWYQQALRIFATLSGHSRGTSNAYPCVILSTQTLSSHSSYGRLDGLNISHITTPKLHTSEAVEK